MPHPNQAVIRELFDLFRSGDRDAAVMCFAEDAVFRYAGPGALHGGWAGRDGILRFWAEQDRRSGGEVRPEMLDMAASDRNVFLLVRMGGEDGDPSWLRVVVYGISDGTITGATVFEDDPTAAEASFSKGE